MKEIIKYNPNTNIGTEQILKTDIILVFKEGTPVGYVHYDFSIHAFKLFINFNSDLEEAFSDDILTKKKDSYKDLGELILDYPNLQFKLID